MLLSKLANEGAVKFLRTVTIKNAYFADQMLKHLVNERFRNSLQDELNPYYIHITGNYVLGDAIEAKVKDPITGDEILLEYGCHSTVQNAEGKYLTVHNKLLYSNFDDMMYVTSLDTRETVPFTREVLHGTDTLSGHEKTLEAYKVGGKYFKRLCARYPNQIDLIKSIVYFAPGSKNPMEIALNAPHLSMISYDESLLEDRERVDIIDHINGFLDMVRDRWDTREYTYEDHYADVMWSIIWTILPMLIVIQRYANVKTPFVHSSHLWDYLTSNGLESYKGYLSQQQEWFLYKNIKYLRDRSGQHRILNILIDNLLSEYNLSIDSKNVVLGKEGILDTVDVTRLDPATQCNYCARANICAKHNAEYTCNKFVGTKDTLKPRPEVLSEPLTGARKERVINLLMEREGIDEATANKRYETSFMWHDEAIEAITAELDRNQTVVMSGATESLQQIIAREYSSGLEPEYSDGLVEEQKNELRHARTSIVPTKILEIVESAKFVKYQNLFSRYITDTLLLLASNDSIAETYKVQVGQEALPFTFNFKEAIAALYLGMVYMHYYNTHVDSVTGAGTKDRKYTSRFFTDLINNPDYNIPIPSRATIGSTFKLGVAVTQETLLDVYNKTYPEHVTFLADYRDAVEAAKEEYLAECRRNHQPEVIPDDVLAQIKETCEIACSEGKQYLVYREASVIENAGLTGDEICLVKVWRKLSANKKEYTIFAVKENTEDKWLGYDTSIEILGWFRNNTYYPNNDRCPVIPTYFVWDNPTEREVPSSTVAVEREGDDPTTNVVGYLEMHSVNGEGLIEACGAPDTSRLNMYRVDKFINVEYIVDNYQQASHIITEQDELGLYYTKMFSILERCVIVDTNTSDAKQHVALEAVLDACIARKKITFSLIGSVTDNIQTYAAWMYKQADLESPFMRILNSDDRDLLWDEFCNKLLFALLEGCDTPYADTGADKNRYNKLRELVTSMSSYLVSFIDTKESSDGFTASNSVRVDNQEVVIQSVSNIHFEEVGEQIGNIPAHYVDFDNDARSMLGLGSIPIPAPSVDQTVFIDVLYDDAVGSVTHLDIMYKDGEWRYRTGHVGSTPVSVETYPNDPDGEEKDITSELNIPASLYVLGLSTDKKFYRYTKTVDVDDIVWDQSGWDDALSSTELTDYMNSKTCKIKLETTSDVIIDVAEARSLAT